VYFHPLGYKIVNIIVITLIPEYNYKIIIAYVLQVESSIDLRHDHKGDSRRNDTKIEVKDQIVETVS